MPTAIHYHFQQPFHASAQKAYQWCTNYAPGDHALMGTKDAGRKIERLAGRTVILTDTFNPGSEKETEKRKLVQLYPETLFWTSTHISGPAKYSQFLYQITAEGENASRLDFTGIFLDYEHEGMSGTDAAKLADRECKDDAVAWVSLAKAMEQDLCGK